MEALGPDGPPIDQHVYETDAELLEQLDSAVAAWVGEAKVQPEDIALLTAHSRERSVLWHVDRLGGVVLTDDPWEAGKVLRCSVHRFKGLERLVVALCELDGARDSTLYVGLSRPSVFLSIFCPRKTLSRLPRIAT